MASPKNSLGWSWLERWMSAKPWENRLMNKVEYDPLEVTPPPKAYINDNIKASISKSSEPCSLKIRKNNITTRISAKPSITEQSTHSSSSPSSEFHYKSSASPSFCTSTTLSRNKNMASNRTGDNSVSKPRYMNPTKAATAKQRYMSPTAVVSRG